MTDHADKYADIQLMLDQWNGTTLRLIEENKELRRLADQEEESAMRSGGILSDVCDILFDDDERASTHGYDGVRSRARGLMANLARFQEYDDRELLLEEIVRLKTGNEEAARRAAEKIMQIVTKPGWGVFRAELKLQEFIDIIRCELTAAAAEQSEPGCKGCADNECDLRDQIDHEKSNCFIPEQPETDLARRVDMLERCVNELSHRANGYEENNADLEQRVTRLEGGSDNV